MFSVRVPSGGREVGSLPEGDRSGCTRLNHRTRACGRRHNDRGKWNSTISKKHRCTISLLSTLIDIFRVSTYLFPFQTFEAIGRNVKSIRRFSRVWSSS